MRSLAWPSSIKSNSLGDSAGVYKSNLYTSKEKASIRDLLIGFLPDRKNLSILTLSGHDMVDALRAHYKVGARVFSVERNRVIWEEQKKKASGYSSIIPLFYEFTDFLDQMTHYPEFDMVYMDFNCIWSLSLEESLSKLFGIVNTGCLIGLTAVKGRDGLESIKDTHCYLKVCAGCPSSYYKDRLNVMTQTITSLSKDACRSVKHLDSREYSNSDGIGTSSPMLSFIFRVEG
jgi:hypothetical protein